MLSHSLGCLEGQMFFSAFKHSLISMVDMLGMVLYDGCIKLNSVTFSESFLEHVGLVGLKEGFYLLQDNYSTQLSCYPNA